VANSATVISQKQEPSSIHCKTPNLASLEGAFLKPIGPRSDKSDTAADHHSCRRSGSVIVPRRTKSPKMAISNHQRQHYAISNSACRLGISIIRYHGMMMMCTEVMTACGRLNNEIVDHDVTTTTMAVLQQHHGATL